MGSRMLLVKMTKDRCGWMKRNFGRHYIIDVFIDANMALAVIVSRFNNAMTIKPMHKLEKSAKRGL